MAKQEKSIAPSDITLNTDREDIQRILGHPPGWTLRWGITVVFIAMLLFLALAWLIKYPDVIEAKTVLVTPTPPLELVAQADGKLAQLFVENQQAVEIGDTIALIENPASLQDIETVSLAMQDLDTLRDSYDLMEISLPQQLQLGLLQATYADLEQAVRDFQFFEQQQGVFAQIRSLEKQRIYLDELNVTLETQEKTLKQEVDNAEKDWIRNQHLAKEEVVATAVLEQKETFYLQYRRQLETLQSEVLRNELLKESYAAEIVSLRQQRTNQHMDKWLTTKAIIELMKSELDSWRQAYLITTPIAGKASLTLVWSPQTYVQKKQEIATVIPHGAEKSADIIGRAQVPIFNSGKIAIGMPVQIQLDGYPYQEFGVLQGRVDQISPVPDQEEYLVQIDLPDTLYTSYQNTIPFRQELSGKARIITKNRRVLERIFDRLLSLVKNNPR